MIVDLVLEGHLEEPVAQKIVTYCGHDIGTSFGRKGFGYIKTSAHKYHSITKAGRAVFVLTDFMDTKCACIVEACEQYLTNHVAQPNDTFLLRFAIAELESWLLADRDGISNFLGIQSNRVPALSDNEADPKQTLVNLARRSRNNEIKRAIIPDEKHGGSVGPNYRPIMQRYVEDVWNIDAAKQNSPSLARCIDRLKALD
jgi:hypothetical protein